MRAQKLGGFSMHPSRRTRMGLGAACVLAAALLAFATIAQAEDINWDTSVTSGSWHAAGNWLEGTVPVNGQSILFQSNADIDVDIDNGGFGVSLPSSALRIENKLNIIDSSGADDYFILDTIAFNGSGGSVVDVYVPVIANKYTTNRHGAIFNAAPTITEYLISGGHQDHTTFNVSPTNTITLIDHTGGGSNDLNINADVTVDTYRQNATSYTGRAASHILRVGAGATFTINTAWDYTRGNIDNKGTIVAPSMPAVMQGGNWWKAGADGSLPSGPITIAENSYLQITAPQSPANWTNANKITVQPGGALIGDMTSADFTSGSPNADLADDSLFGPTTGGPWTRAMVNKTGATLWRIALNSDSDITTGDDGVSPFKGAALNGVYGTYRMHNKTFRAAAGTGNLRVRMLNGNPQVGNATRWYGDGTSTTADIETVGGGRVHLQKAFNENADYGAEPTLIDTFNITGQVGREATTALYLQEGHTHIYANQTLNVTNGKIDSTSDLTGTMPGTLSLTNGVFQQPGDDFAATDGTLTFAGNVAIEAYNPSNYDYLEPLQNFSVAPDAKTVVLLSHNTTYSFDYDDVSGAYPRFAALLKTSDYARKEYQATTYASDVQIGHGQFFYNSFFRNNSGYQNAATGAEAFKYAQNGPLDGTDWIGFAAMRSDHNINMDVDAPNTIVQVGTDDPNRLYEAITTGGFNFQRPAETVRFRQNFNAKGLRIRSGTAWFANDLVIDDIDVGAGSSLQMNGGTSATVLGKLSGTGNWSGGNGVVLAQNATVAPGHSVGALNQGGGLLEFSDSIVYEWELADATGGPGVGWDIVWGAPLRFIGDPGVGITIEILDAGLVGLLDGSDYFAIAAGTFEPPDELLVELLDNITFNAAAAGWDVSGCQLELGSTDADGDGEVEPVLYLTGLVVTDEPGPGPDVIPEPATLSLLGLGALALLRRRRRR